MICFIRSFIFDCFFYIFTTFYLSVFAPVMLIFPRPVTVFLFRTWSRIIKGALHWIVGLKQVVVGQDILDHILSQGPCILAVKHQSACETIFCSLFTKRLVIVLKRQLLKIPVYGLYLKKLNSIVVDRDNPAMALKKMIKDAKAAIDNHMSIFIFPEGTRQAPGESTEYKGGVGLLYKTLNVPVVPIALNTGAFWGRRSFLKKPGTIVYQILDPILPGMDRNEFLNHLQKVLNDASDALLVNDQDHTQTLKQKAVKAPRRFLRHFFFNGALLLMIIMAMGGASLHYLNRYIETMLQRYHVSAQHVSFVLSWNDLPHIRLDHVEMNLSPAYRLVCKDKVRLYPIDVHKFTCVLPHVHLYCDDQPHTPLMMVDHVVAIGAFGYDGALSLPRIEGQHLKIYLNQNQSSVDQSMGQTILPAHQLLEIPSFIFSMIKENQVAGASKHFSFSTPMTQWNNQQEKETLLSIKPMVQCDLRILPMHHAQGQAYKEKKLNIQTDALEPVMKVFTRLKVLPDEEAQKSMASKKLMDYMDQTNVWQVTATWHDH